MKFISNTQKGEKSRMPKIITQDKYRETPFQIFLLKNDKTNNVEVIELNQINFEKVTSNLQKGESILITHKKRQKLEIDFIANDITEEPWYLIRS